jgi:hypothetical protein
MAMIAAIGLLIAGFGATVAVLFVAFVSGIAAGERVEARDVMRRR